MFTLQGSGVGKGIAIGTAYVMERSATYVPSKPVERAKLGAEIALLDLALKRASDSLIKAMEVVPEDAPKEITAFLDAHMLMVEDPTLREATVEIMQKHSYSAETALMIHRNQLVEVFDAMEDEYLRSKKNDVDQVIQQIHHQLLDLDGEREVQRTVELEGRILVAHDLTPADTVLFMKMKMSAFVTNLGSPISHVAILARSLQIPAVVGLHVAIKHIEHGTTIAVDSTDGTVIVDPDENTLAELKARQQEYEDHHQKLLALRDLEPRTLDGHVISLLANVELPTEIEPALGSGATGVGLYRTEYLFMNRKVLPTEEEQFEAYSKVVKALGSVTIRTLDLGADKQVDGGRAQGKVAINPALGIRAVRFCLRAPGMFRAQLRAIFRAAVYGNVQCMIPMLSNLDELDQVMEIINDVKYKLDSEKVKHDPSVPIGGMIEVPAAAITADQFAQRLDFLSIGTNDLIQYTLAIDRVDDEVNYLYDPLHPSVLRLVKHTIDAGAKCNIPVSLCGEMASDGNYTRLLLGMGLRIFSMDPVAVPEVKQIIRNSYVNDTTGCIDTIFNSTQSTDRFDFLQRLNENHFHLPSDQLSA